MAEIPELNVFVLGTGRCGTVTFSEACRHITNYSSSHESRVSIVGSQRLAYPPRHIEVDNRLSWMLGRLERIYGDEAVYVHMVRNPLDTARSYEKRWWPGSLISAYVQGIYLYLPEDVDRLACSQDLVETVNANVEQFLKSKTRTMRFSLENAESDFRDFWRLISAEGDLNAAIRVWAVRHNASEVPAIAPETLPSRERSRNPASRAAGKVLRALRALPQFFRNN